MAFENGLVLHSKETPEELAATFVRTKFDKYISLQARLRVISEFEIRSFLVQITKNITICRDSKDDKFLSLAVSARANCIISGDKDLLVLHPFRNIPILSPLDFLTLQITNQDNKLL
jgi:putative PIN family toxin of toxin-antitoxin system